MDAEAGNAPYIGLRPFSPADSGFFFGRNTERRIITANLTAARLTVLFGPSGTGKSSVLHAGVVYDLAQGARSESEDGPRDAAVYFRDWSKWRNDPLAGVTQAIHEGLRRDFAIDLTAGNGADFSATIDAWMRTQRGGLLIILDQFEEYLLYHEQDEIADTFARAFPGLVSSANLRVNVLISLRDDALARLDRFKAEIPHVFDNRLELKLLSRSAAEDAIRNPLKELRRRGLGDVTIEDALVESVLDQVAAGRVKLGSLGEADFPPPEERATGDRPIEAPYLQLVMERIWQEEQRLGSTTLRKDTFKNLGWAQRIVQDHLDSRMARLTEAEQETAAKVFRYLVTPSGAKIALSPYDLAQSARITQERVEAMLEGLAKGDSRVLRSVASPLDDPRERRFEIYHDALARAILDWTSRREKSADERRLRDTEARLRREQRKKIIARGAAGVLGVGVVLLFTGLLLQQHRTKLESRSRALAAQATRSLSDDPERGVLLALHAASLTYGRYRELLPEVADALHGALAVARGRGILRGGAAPVHAVAASPDGFLVASGDESGAIDLWDAPSARKVRTLFGRGGAVMALAFSPDGRHLAAAYSDGLTILWPLRDAADTMVLRGHRGSVFAVAYDFLGRWLVTGGADSTARLWDAASGRAVFRFPGHRGEVRAVGFAEFGLSVVTSSDSTARVWDRDTRQPKCTFRSPGSVYALRALPPFGRNIVSAGNDGSAQVWVAKTCVELRRLPGHTNSIFAIAVSPDGDYVATTGADGTVKVWNPHTQAELFALTGHHGDVVAVEFSPDGRRLYTASVDSTARVWDASRVISEVDVLQPRDETDVVRGVAFNPRRLVLAAINTTTGVVLVSDLRRPRRSYTRSFGDYAYMYGVAFSPDGERLAVGGYDGVRVLDVETGGLRSQLDTVRLNREGVGAVQAIAFSPDGARIAVGGDRGGIALWTPANDSTLLLSGHRGPVTTVAFGPDGNLLATGGNDGMAVLWKLHRNTVSADTVERNPRRVMAIALSPDGRLLATGGDQNVIRVAPVSPPWSELAVVPVTNTVWSLAFSPDGARLASASFDGTARLWDVDSAKEVFRLPSHHGRAWGVSFSHDGHYVASAGYGAIHVSIIDPSTLLLNAWSHVNRSLSEEECRVFLQESGCPPAEDAVVDGLRLARSGDYGAASARFAEARRLDPTFRKADPDSLARALAAETWIARGLALLKAGRMTEAMSEFRNARTFDVSGAGDIVPEVAGGIAELLRSADTSIVDSALAAYEEAVRWNEKFAPTAQTLNSLCWWGTLGGHWTKVEDICEAAVNASPDDGDIRDSRGVNRALNRNPSGAIQDFQAFVAYTSNEQQRAQRRNWIRLLRAGRNPFTRQTLAALRVE